MDALIDTSIIVDLLRQDAVTLAWMNTSKTLQLAITPLVWMELIKGARDKSSQDQIARSLTPYALIYLTDADMRWAMQQFRSYTLSHGVGIIDSLIAAPAHRLQLPLYTKNLKHFGPLLGALAQNPY